MGEGGTGLTHFIGNRCYMRLVDGHCGALGVAAAAPRFACGVYETRPETCRLLERGSPECLAEHARKYQRAAVAPVQPAP